MNTWTNEASFEVLDLRANKSLPRLNFNAPASRLKNLCRGVKSIFRSWSSRPAWEVRTSRTLIFQSNGIKCSEGRVASPPCGSLPCHGLDGVAKLRPGRPQLAWASRHSLGTGGSVQSFLEGITTVQRNAFGQGAKFGTDPLSSTVSPRVRLFDWRPQNLRNSGFPRFREH